MLELPHAACQAMHGLYHACWEACTLWGLYVAQRAWQTRPRSLRSRSTIIRFSARSFSEASSRAAAAASDAASAPRAAVPLTGRASRLPSRSPRRKRSGDEQHTCSRSGDPQGAHGSARLRPPTAASRHNGRREASACTAAACKNISETS